MPACITVEVCTKLLVENDEPIRTRKNSNEPVLWFEAWSKRPDSMSKLWTTSSILDLLHKVQIIYGLFFHKHAEMRAGGRL